MLGTLGIYTLGTADGDAFGQLRQQKYAAIVSGVRDDGTLDIHFFLTHPTTVPIAVRRNVSVGDGEPGTFSPQDN